MANELEPVLRLDRAPRNVAYLLRPEDVERDRPIVLDVYRCRRCGHVQLAVDPDDAYYEEYVMTVSHSPQMREFQRAQARNFVARFDLADRRVVEVGCGDGHYLRLLGELGVRATGIEPSAGFRRLARAAGHEVLAGYVTAEEVIPGGPYDAFVAREVLEHVPDPTGFLLGIRRSLTDSGAGLVEVPSLEQALEHARFYDFFRDHVNYFTAGTLARALERNGFLVLEVTRGMGGEYLQALVRVDAGRDFGALRAAVDGVADELRRLLAERTARGDRVAAWGSGAKGLASLAQAGAGGIEYVIDSDPHKQGRLTPVTHLPVVAPEHLLKDRVDVIVLTALAYRQEIVADLRGRLDFRGTIVVLASPLEVLDS
ncbi:MAG: methyltransferase domain-containing protein [Solirubrobacteraceae bacterium]